MQAKNYQNDQSNKNNINKNYLKPLKRNEEEFPKAVMKDKEDLHGMLHKLKNYYNELNKLRNKKLNQLEELKDKFQGLNKQIEEKLAFSDIDFPNERITIEDYEKFNDSKETRESIQIKIENLTLEKNQLLQKYENEIEYGNKINNLINIEKKNYDDIYEHVLQTQEKINTLKMAHKNLEINREEKVKKEKIFVKVKKDLECEINKLDDVIDFQTKNYFNIVAELKSKNEINQQKFKEIEMKDVNLEMQHKKSSDKIITEIQKSKQIKSLNREKESQVIKLILGFDIIKKYFIDLVKQGKEINTSELIKSEDYKTFMSEKFSIKENNYESVSSTSNNLNNININSSDANFKLYTNYNTTNEDDKYPTRSKISLKTLKDKLDNLDIDYDKIYDFYTKIMNKTNFFHNHMINFNLKKISLENKKEMYTEKVRQIISKNSKNIEDLKRYDSNFEYLFRNFEKEIKSTSMYENLKRKIKDFDPNPSQYVDFYKKCGKYLSDVKTFNEFLKFNFKKIKLDCTEDSLKSVIFDNNKKIKENIKNEKNISNIEKIEYIRDLFKNIELEYLKENKKLEKILRAIEEYPGDKTPSVISTENDNNIRINGINNDFGTIFSQKNKYSDPNTDTDNNKEEECIENSQNLECNENNTNNSRRNEINLDILEQNRPTNYEDNNIKQTILKKKITYNSNKNNNNNNDNQNISKNLSKSSNTNILKSENYSDFSHPVDLVAGFPYISPYSGWSISKLDEERENTINKINLLKSKINVGKLFEDNLNLNNLITLDVPFEKTIFYFFENTSKIIENIKIAKMTTDLFSQTSKENKLKPIESNGGNKNISPDSK